VIAPATGTSYTSSYSPAPYPVAFYRVYGRKSCSGSSAAP
jgi:hypothetical protein